MRKTEFLKLHLPDENEYYNVELDQNQNFIMVDGKLKEHDTALTTIQRGATTEQKGIVQFGTEEGKALEGMMLARLAGAYGFGGDIQNTGVKNQNYIYYDRNTRKMYKCLNQNSDTSASVQNFIPVDNISLLDRLENLKRNFKTLWQGSSNEVQFYTTNAEANVNFNNIYSLTIIGNTTCTLPGIVLKNLPYNQELIIGHDNGVRSDAIFYFKKINENFGIFGTKGVAEDIHLAGFNTLIAEY